MFWIVVIVVCLIYMVFDSVGLFVCYEVIVSLFEDMVDVVECGDWDEVSLFECECVVYMECLGYGLCLVLLYEEV